MVSVEQVGWLFAKERITAGEHLGPENTANYGLGGVKNRVRLPLYRSTEVMDGLLPGI